MSQNSLVKPEVIFVDDILKDIEQGMLKVPAFQRSYVWQPKQVLELFDSIFHGYPIGSVLLWETEINMRSFDVFPHSDFSTSNKQNYIVDGQQRLTTLFHCLTKEEGIDGIWNVYADLKTGRFLHLDKNESFKSHYFPLKKIRSTSDFLKECTRVLKETGSEQLIERAEHLSDTLRKYKLSVIKMIGGDLEEAIEIFTRLNRTGLDILPFDIVNALNYADEGNSAFTLLRDDMISYIEKGDFFNSENNKPLFESDIYLKLVRISSGFQLYGKKDTIRLSDHCKSEEFKIKSSIMLEALKKTIKFLSDDLLCFRFSDLPYTNLFYMLYKYFFNQLLENRPINPKRVKQNFYFSILSGLPSGSPSLTERVLDFFGNDFDQSLLTKKLAKDFTNENLVENYITGIKNGIFSATSAPSKLLFNIITHKYFQSVHANHDKELLKYPPNNLFLDEYLKGRLGNKFFFIKSYTEGDESIIPQRSAVESNEDFIKYRENCLATLADSFFENLKD